MAKSTMAHHTRRNAIAPFFLLGLREIGRIVFIGSELQE